MKVKNAMEKQNSIKGMRILEEERDSILNRVVVVGLTEKINWNKDLKEVMLGAVQIYGGSVFFRLMEQLA